MTAEPAEDLVTYYFSKVQIEARFGPVHGVGGFARLFDCKTAF